jgi:hypothetical protein
MWYFTLLGRSKNGYNQFSIVFRFLLVLSLLIIPFRSFAFGYESAHSDSAKSYSFVLMGFYEKGWVLGGNNFLKGNNYEHIPIKSFSAYSIELVSQTTGKKLWQQLYNYPRFGVGIYNAILVDHREVGAPIAIFGMLDLPIFRSGNFSFYSSSGFGFCFNWKSFKQDHYNIAMGAQESFYLDGGFTLEYKFNTGFLIDLDASLTHFSNGDIQKPNWGINLVGPKLRVGYNFNNYDRPFLNKAVQYDTKKTECQVSFFTGIKNIVYPGNDVDMVTKNRGVYYPVFGVSTTFNRQVGFKSRFGLGITTEYYSAANPLIVAHNGHLYKENAPFTEGIEVSIYPSYSLVIDRLALVLQPGFYIYRAKYPSPSPVFYQRLGLKYDIFKNIYAGIFLRAYKYNISDYIEWTIGYRFHLNKRI